MAGHKSKGRKMRFGNFLGILIVLVIGYCIGAKFPALYRQTVGQVIG